jgi:hypothetical protein
MRTRGFVRSLPWVAGAVLAVAVAATARRSVERPRAPGPKETRRSLLMARIARDLPRLGEATLGDTARLTLLRQWAYENTDWSTPGANLDDDRANGFYEMDAPQLYGAFSSDRGGVLCGGTAYAFMRLCRLFGYDALTLDFGLERVSTHVVTLVRLRRGGRDVWSVQDPTYDAAYVHRSGEPFDYLDLLRALCARQDDRVKVERGQGRPREFLVAPADAESMLPGLVADGSVEGLGDRLPGGTLKYRRRYSIDTFRDIDGSATAAGLRREGHPARALYLFLHPIRISGGWEFDREQRGVPREARPRFMMKRVREILDLEGERP